MARVLRLTIAAGITMHGTGAIIIGTQASDAGSCPTTTTTRLVPLEVQAPTGKIPLDQRVELVRRLIGTCAAETQVALSGMAQT